MRPGPNGGGLSRKAILAEIDASLTRLGTDYVDLYQIHRWDHAVPIEETLKALDDVVKSGRPDISEPPRCSPGNSAKPCIFRDSTAGLASYRCRTTTTCSTGRKSVRCCRCAPTRRSARFRGVR